MKEAISHWGKLTQNPAEAHISDTLVLISVGSL